MFKPRVNGAILATIVKIGNDATLRCAIHP
jgi:hypothetical protein